MSQLPNPATDGNLNSHPYRVMYNETMPLQGGGRRTADKLHCSVSTLEDAMKTICIFREYASKGQHFVHHGVEGACLNSAWIEYEHRSRLEV